jgi:putative flippase GtrA
MMFVDTTAELNLKRYFKGASLHAHVQFVRYGLVAVAAFTVDIGSLAAQVNILHIHYLVAAAFAFCLGLIVNFLLSTAWVFSAYQSRNRLFEFGIFAITGLVGLGLTEVLIWLFTAQFHLFYLISKLAAAFIVVIWNFAARKVLLYR